MSDVNDNAATVSEQRWSKVDIAKRHTVIGEMIGRSVPSGTIVSLIAEQFGISTRQARTDVAKVRSAWASEIARDEPNRRAMLLVTLDRIISEAIEDHAWGAAVAGCREIARIVGCNAAIVYKVKTGPLSADGEAMPTLPIGEAMVDIEDDEMSSDQDT